MITSLLGVCVAGNSTDISADSIVLDDDSAVAEGSVIIEGEDGTLYAETLSIGRNSQGQVIFVGSNVRWTPCTCDAPPWAISAAEVEGNVDTSAVLRNASLEVCGARVLPVPWARFPLNKRRPRVLFPEFGHGVYGPRVGTPVWFPVGSASEITVTPELRVEQALRPKISVEGPKGRASGAIAREFASNEVRWNGRAVSGMDDGKIRLAVSSQWLSDTQVLEDYGTDFTARSTPFAEQLMVGSVGPLRLESNTFDRGIINRPLGAVLSIAGENMGPVAVDAETRVDWIELGDESLDLQRSFSRVALRSGQKIGITETRMGADVRAIQWSDGGPWVQGRAEGGWFLPVWGRVGKLVHIAEAGVEGMVSRKEGALEDRLPWEKEDPRWRYGPTLRSVFVGPTGVPLSTEVQFHRSFLGWTPTFAANVNRKNITGWLQADEALQAGRIGYSDEGFGGGLGAVHGAGLVQSFGDTHVSVLRRWTPGLFGLYDHINQQWVRYGSTLQWDSGCNCLAVDVGLEWARDREYPEAWLRLDLRSMRGKDKR